MEIYNQQPSEILDYDVDFTDWLALGDSVESTVVSSKPTGLIIGITADTTDIPKIWVSGGIDKVRYTISTVATTTQGRSKEVNFQIKIKDV